MRKKASIFKHTSAVVLSAAMVLSSVGVMPGVTKTASAASGGVLPTPNYCFDFDGELTANGATPVVNTEVEGAKVEIVEDATKGKVLHITDGGTEVYGKNYFKLPADTFKNVSADTGATVSMNVKLPNTLAHEWSVLFCSNSGYNQWGLWKINANRISDINGGTPQAYGSTAKTETTGEFGTAIEKDTWHNVVMTLTKEYLIVYLDGVVTGKAVVAEAAPANDWGSMLELLSTNSFNVLGAGGFPAAEHAGDRDISECYYDDVTIYSEALTAEQISAIYNKTPLAENALTLDKATDTVSNTYYYENNDENGNILFSECGSTQLTAVIAENSYAKSITWSVDETGKDKATVNATGKVTLTDKARQGDTINVIATATGCDGNTQTATCAITVNIVKGEETNKVTALAVEDKEITVEYTKKGTEIVPTGDVTITPTFTTENSGEPTINTVEYTTDEAGSKIVAIDGNKVSALKAGVATVTATSKSASAATTTFKVTVKEKAIPTSFTATGYAVAGENTGYSRLEGDFDVVYKFTNKSTGTNNWDNFIVDLTDGVNTTRCRADRAALDQGLGTVTWNDEPDWTAFNADMANGANVEVHLRRQGNALTFEYTIKGTTEAANEYKIVGKSTGENLAPVLYATLLGEKVEISNLTLTNVPHYKVSIAEGTPATFEHGSIDALDTTKDYAAGDVVSITTKPDAGFSADITVSYKEGEETKTVATTAAAGENGAEIVSFIMPAADVTVKYNGFKGVDHAAVKAAVEAAKAVVDAGNASGKYTAASWDAFKKAYDAAVAADAKEGVTQAELDTATADLKKAQTGLVFTCKIALSKTEVSLTAGGTETLTATVTTEGTDKSVKWTSSKDAVATVKDGVVTAVAAGEATITATAADGTAATCKVTVTAKGGNDNPGGGDNPGTNPTDVETLTGTAWWTGNQIGKDYELKGDGSIKLNVEVAEAYNNETAFNAELVGADAAGTKYYLTTGSLQDAWNAEGSKDVGTITINKGTPTALVVGHTYSITATRAGQDFTVKYYDETAKEDYCEFVWTGSNMPETVNLHIIAQLGTFKVSKVTGGDTPGGDTPGGDTPGGDETKASLSLNKSKATLYTGKASNKTTVKATVAGASKTVTWKSSKPKVAKVSKSGSTVTITAVGKGTTTITATANGIKKTVKVTVKNPTITVKNGKKKVGKSLTVKKKKAVKLTITTSPKKAGATLAKLSKKNKKVLTASLKKGKLTIKGKKKGTVTLSIKSGKATKKIKVKVK